MKPTILISFLTASLGGLAAQSPLSGLAQGLIIENASTNSCTIQGKPAGDRSLLQFPANGLAPTFTVPALLHHLGANASFRAQQFHMNAISTGNDNIPVTEMETHWEVTPASGAGWAAISISVVQKTSYTHLGVSTAFGKRLALGPGGRGNDLYSYWFADNAGVPVDLVDAAFFDVGQEHMSLAAGAQVIGVDTYMPAVVEAQGSPTFLVPVVGRWFFTLTPASADHIRNPANWSAYSGAFAPGTSPSTIRPNHVFRAQWTPSGWNPIEVAFTPLQLGLGAEDVIDAIAYFDVVNHKDRIVFSLAQSTSAPSEQVLIGGPDVAGGNKPLKAKGGQSITQRIGIGNDTDVDSLCTYDPETLPGFDFCKWMAMPEWGQQPAVIGSSAARFRASATEDAVLLQATNLPNEVGDVIWVVTVGGRTITIPRARTGNRMQTFLRLPTATSGTIVIDTTFVTSSAIRRGWTLKLQS